MIHYTLLYVSHENTAFRGNHQVEIEFFIFCFLAICKRLIAKTGLYPGGLTDSLLPTSPDRLMFLSIVEILAVGILLCST